MVNLLSGLMLMLIFSWQTAFAVALPEPEGKVELPAAASPFTEDESKGVRIYPQSVMLGQSITVLIRGDSLVRDFKKFDLQTLKQQFAVYDVTRESSRVRLQLYPLAAGRSRIEATDIGALHIPETTIEVQPNSQVDVVWQAPPPRLFSGQNVIWSAHVKLHNPAFETHFVADKQVQLVASEADEYSNQQTWVANYRWQLPLSDSAWQTQRVLVDSPVLEVKNTSQRTWRFFDRPQALDIKPLPSFLPITAQVGRVELTTQTDGLWQVNGALHYWRWNLQANGVQAEDLKNMAYRLVAELPHNPAIEWFSASLESAQTLTETGMVTTVEVRLPYRVNAMGLVSLPSLTWRTLEPESGKLVAQTRPVEFILAIPSWLEILLKISGLLGLFWLVWQVLQFSQQWWLKQHLKRQISQADTPQAIWHAMRFWKAQQAGSFAKFLWRLLKFNRPGAEVSEMENISLAQFETWFVERYGASMVLQSLLCELNTCFYARCDEKNFTSLQTGAQGWADEPSIRPKLWRLNRG